MRTLVPLAVAGLLLAALPAAAQDKPVRVAYYYKVRWGFQQEFERLFLKNHYPLLMAQRKDGRIKGVSLYRPTFHGEGRADWTFLVVIEFASFSALGARSVSLPPRGAIHRNEVMPREQRPAPTHSDVSEGQGGGSMNERPWFDPRLLPD